MLPIRDDNPTSRTAWVTLAVFPFEIAHDAIEDELKRQGVEL